MIIMVSSPKRLGLNTYEHHSLNKLYPFLGATIQHSCPRRPQQHHCGQGQGVRQLPGRLGGAAHVHLGHRTSHSPVFSH